MTRRRPRGRADPGADRFGSPTRLAVLDRSGGWLEVSTEALGAARRGWLRADAVRLSTRPTGSRSTSRRGGSSCATATGCCSDPRRRRSSAHPTPTGRFGITDRLSGRRFDGVYGCCVLAVSAIQTNVPREWQGGNRIALHGTSSPWSFGRAVSTGCVRVRRGPAAGNDAPAAARGAGHAQVLSRA